MRKKRVRERRELLVFETTGQLQGEFTDVHYDVHRVCQRASCRIWFVI